MQSEGGSGRNQGAAAISRASAALQRELSGARLLLYSNEGEGAERAKLLVCIYGYDQNLSLYCDLHVSTDEKGVVVCVMDSVTDSLMSTYTHM